MKFVCSNCMTQYLISDDRVGSRGVKVRCKRCGNVIVVHPSSSENDSEDPLATDPGLSDDGSDEHSDTLPKEDGDEVGQAFDQLLAGGRGDDEDDDDERATEIFNLNNMRKSEQAFDDRDKIDQVFADAESTELRRDSSSSQEDAQWYVAIGDEQIGPISRAEIEARCKAGEIDGKTLSWCPGMDNWLALQEVEALRDIFELVVQNTRDKTDVDASMSVDDESGNDSHEEDEQWAPYQGSELASLVEEEMAAVASSPPPDEPDEEGDILGGVVDDDEEIPPWEQEEPQSGDVAKPNDSFFDSTLDPSGGENTGASYGRSGVIGGPAYLGTGKNKSSKGKWIAIGILSGVILVAGSWGLYVLFRAPEEKLINRLPVVPPDVSSPVGKNAKDTNLKKAALSPPSPISSDKENSKDAVKQPNKNKIAPKSDKSEKDNKAEQMVVVKPATVKKSSVKKPKQPARKNRRKKKKNGGKDSVAKNTLKTSKNVSKSSGSTGVNTSLPLKLSKAQIGKTMMEFVQSMRTCVNDQNKRDPTVTGVMKVSFTIQPNGTVKGIKVLTKEHVGTYVAGCISYIIKSMHFPKAQGPSKVPMLPLKLGG